MISAKGWSGLLGAVAMLSACGGGGSDGSGPAAAPGVLYVGHYQEDPVGDPDDPSPGALAVTLPAGDANFTGSMYFTHLACQASNVGNISGSKTGSGLSGSWTGTIDGSPQAGSLTGSYDPAAGAWSGSYLNAGGRQFRDLSPCTTYTIAANGSWEVFPVDTQVPANFTVAINGRSVTWGAIAEAAYTLVYVLDPALAQAGANPVLWQTVLDLGLTATIPSTVTLQGGKQYIVAVGVSNLQHQRTAFGSRRFTP